MRTPGTSSRRQSDFAGIRWLLVWWLVLTCLAWRAGAETYDVKGHQIEVTLVAEKPKVLLGEPTRMRYVVRNLSQDTLYTLHDTLLWSNPVFSITAVGANGKSAKQFEEFGVLDFMLNFHELVPGGTCCFDLLLPYSVTFETPGAYTVSAEYTLDFVLNEDGSLFAGSKDADPFAKLPHTPHLHVETRASAFLLVEPADPAALGHVIAALADTMLHGSAEDAQTASTVLACIRDARTIPSFTAAALGQNPYLPEIAIGALGRYNDRAAFKALQRLLAARSGRYRLEACYALENSPYPQAMPYLVGQRHHLPAYIRRVIVDGAGTHMKPAKAATILREMTHDEDKEVRERAEQGLQRLRAAKRTAGEKR